LDFCSLWSACNSKGEIIIGSWADGFLLFHPDSLKSDLQVPDVILSDLWINNEEIRPARSPILDEVISFTSKITLQHSENNLTLGFSVLDYQHSGSKQHRYMMEGLDKSWIYSGGRNSVTYSNLKPGSYVFRASGASHDGRWNEEGTSLEITILPPFWLRWWAYLFYVVSLCILGLMVWQFLNARSRRRTMMAMERLEMNKALELEKEKSRFFANISHELRTPLTLITGPISDLADPASKLENKHQRAVELIQRNAQKLLILINQLLSISKIENGTTRLKVAQGDFSASVEDIADSFKPMAESRGIQFTTSIIEAPQNSYLDEEKLHTILGNLLSNAMKFTPEGETVELNLGFSKEGGLGRKYALITVKDTGPGIPQEDQLKIFDRFFQARNRTGYLTEGAGIGLSIVKDLVDLYKGSITLHSILGVGTTFTVKLPVSKEAFLPEEIMETDTIKDSKTGSEFIPEVNHPQEYISECDDPENPEIDSNKSVVLVVDDNLDIRTYLEEVLSDEFHVVLAANGNEGMKKALCKIPDLIISDLMMPGMDGNEYFQRLRSDHRTCHIPFIMLTANATREKLLQGFDSGMDAFLLKPFDSAELLVRARAIIKKRKELRKYFSNTFFPDQNTEPIPSPDEIFREKVLEYLQKNYADPKISVEDMADFFAMSRSQLYRKALAITDQTPSILIRNYRLGKAANLFQNGHKNVTSVMYEVGFNSTSHFARSFRDLYGVNPSEYAASAAT
jgi:signal transduction histidine kinase/DNA-binding response OmpR family regulator